MRLEEITDALHVRDDLTAWSVRHIRTRGAQQYELHTATEAQRHVEDELYVIDVLRDTTKSEGEPSCGSGNVTLLPGGDLQAAIESAALTAATVHNEPYDFPKPATIPEVALSDETIQNDASGAIQSVITEMKNAASNYPAVRLTAAECFAEEQTVRLVNNHGIDATQVGTQVLIEAVFIAQDGEVEVESFATKTRRRIADLEIADEVAHHVQQTSDLLHASTPPDYHGPVVLGGDALTEFLTSSFLQVRSSGQLKYTGETPWEIDKPIFKGDWKGDPLNLWANRRLPFGINSNRFDDEGIPAQRVALIGDNKLATFMTTQRYAHYLNIPPTGAFGDIELAPGMTPAAALTEGRHVEIAMFSWFNPHLFTGDFASEIRLGYIVEGDTRIPFKGGMLIGNMLDALADVHWSKETGFFGSYQGPRLARFNTLTISG